MTARPTASTRPCRVAANPDGDPSPKELAAGLGEEAGRQSRRRNPMHYLRLVPVPPADRHLVVMRDRFVMPPSWDNDAYGRLSPASGKLPRVMAKRGQMDRTREAAGHTRCRRPCRAGTRKRSARCRQQPRPGEGGTATGQKTGMTESPAQRSSPSSSAKEKVDINLAKIKTHTSLPSRPVSCRRRAPIPATGSSMAR